MKKIEQKIIQFVEQNELVNHGDKILVALSGGPDSVLALHFFFKFRKKFKVDLFAVHFNHRLRGKEADKDEAFCEKFCEQINIPFYSSKLDVKSFAKKNKLSIEEAARKLRYQNLDEIARDFNCNKIITAHNKSDNTETVLLNLSSGTGINGLSGIPVKRGKIIRPLLCLSKPEITGYLKSNRIPYRIDSSNLSNDFKRNYLRNEIIPELAANVNPKIDDAVFRTSKTLERFIPGIEEKINRLTKRYLLIDKNRVVIKQKLFEAEPDHLIGEILKKILLAKFNYEFKYSDLFSIKGLTSKQKGKSVHLSSNLYAIKEADSVEIVERKTVSKTINYKLSPGKEVEINGKRIGIAKVRRNQVNFSHPAKNEFIDADKLDDIFILRKWKSGDRFFPLGMNSSKKLSDFLTDLKIPSSEKKDIMVLTNRNKIVWVPGLRIDDRVKLTNETKAIYKLWIK